MKERALAGTGGVGMVATLLMTAVSTGQNGLLEIMKQSNSKLWPRSTLTQPGWRLDFRMARLWLVSIVYQPT